MYSNNGVTTIIAVKKLNSSTQIKTICLLLLKRVKKRVKHVYFCLISEDIVSIKSSGIE